MSCETKDQDLVLPGGHNISKHVENVIDIDELGEPKSCLSSAELGHANTNRIRTTLDGQTVLIPQPSEDPNDPLNWSQTKKNVILLVVSCTGAKPVNLRCYCKHLLQFVVLTPLGSFLARLWIGCRGCYASPSGCVSVTLCANPSPIFPHCDIQIDSNRCIESGMKVQTTSTTPKLATSLCSVRVVL